MLLPHGHNNALIFKSSASLVSMIPNLTKIFTGDLLYLHCDSNQTEPSTTWDFNGNMAAQTNTLKIAAASSKDSGIYKCTINGQTSDGFNLKVLGKNTDGKYGAQTLKDDK